MPKASEIQANVMQAGRAQKTIAKVGFKKSQLPPKDVMDVLLVLDWKSIHEAGAERTLDGVHRLLSIEKSRLHLLHLDQKMESKEQVPDASFIDPQTMLSRIHACLQKVNFEIAEEQMTILDAEMMSQLLEDIKQSEYDLLVLCIPLVPSPKEAMASKHFTQYLASHAPISVLVWRKSLSEQPHPLKVMFGVDGSESSLVAANKAADLLHLKYAHLFAVSVLSPIFQDNAVTAPFVNPDILDEALDANARIIFEMTTRILESRGVPKPTCKKLIGSPATELGYYAEVENPDVMVVGSHNRKGLMAWLMGSVSSQLLQWDTHNLLVVR